MLGSIVEGEMISVEMLLSIIMDDIVKLSVSINVMEEEGTSLVRSLVKIMLALRLGNIVGGEDISGALINVIGIAIVVLTSGCVVVKMSSLVLTNDGVGTPELFKTGVGVTILVKSKEGTILAITLVTDGIVKLNVSVNGNTEVGEITSVTTLAAVATVSGRVKAVSSILTTSLLSTMLDIVMTLEISNDGNVVNATVSIID